MQELLHIPVLLNEVIELSGISEKKNPRILDATLGLGGHFSALLQKNPEAIGYANDCDQAMLDLASQGLTQAGYRQRCFLRQGNFVDNVWQQEGPFDVILADLGVSSLHLDSFTRGISFRENQVLDMRLNPSEGIPVYQWLAEAAETEIRRILFLYGEEAMAAKIAANIVRYRSQNELRYTDQLKQICVDSYGIIRKKKSQQRYTEKNPYVKTFQALRIFINNEIEHLEQALEFWPNMLTVGGRLLIISFHSLEDRLVKSKFRSLIQQVDDSKFAKSHFKASNFEIVTSKAVTASESEVIDNSRAKPAKLRVLQRRGME